MKTLYLVRHAKSDKGNPLLKDFDRPLNQRGYRDAYFMSNKLMEEKHLPGLLITSPAVRAYSTALIFLKTFGFNTGKIILNELLYEGDAEIYVNQIKSVSSSINSFMLFAHNPTITEAGNFLSETPLESFPTCGIVCLDFNVKKWSEISAGNGRMRFYEIPN